MYCNAQVMVDVNWRPVFWNDNSEAKREILAFLDMADIVKISDADLEFLYDMQFVTALLNPCAVRGATVCVFCVHPGVSFCVSGVPVRHAVRDSAAQPLRGEGCDGLCVLCASWCLLLCVWSFCTTCSW
jgi:sugar/nucleoside kinase (ribokinase family)